MDEQRRRPLPAWGATCVALVFLSACDKGSKPGALVGSYAVHGVLVENTCGQNALPTSNPLDFVVEIRTDSGVAYWMPNKASQNTGTLKDSGSFRFAMSETQVLEASPTTRQEQPSDFLSARPDFDLRQQDRGCILTRKQIVQGKLGRRLEEGVVNATAKTDDKDAETDWDSNADLNGEHLIEVTPSSGSDCNGALAALGGTYLALPCEARYVLSGSLDTSSATLGGTVAAGAGGDAKAQAGSGR